MQDHPLSHMHRELLTLEAEVFEISDQMVDDAANMPVFTCSTTSSSSSCSGTSCTGTSTSCNSTSTA